VPYLILFVFGLAIGSFMNVLALRYDGAHFLFDPKIIGGRSRCPHCKHTLRWFELVPLLSYVVQGAKCRNCGARIGVQYPIVELLSAAVFALVPYCFSFYPWLSNIGWYFFSAMWIAALEILLLIAYIDIRLQIIPDELNVMLGLTAIFETIFAAGYLGPDHQSFFGGYAIFFGTYDHIWISHFAGAAFGLGFFGLLVILTRGKGMGIGDVKFGLPLGFLFGWPDTLFLVALAFVIGAVVGVVSIALGKKTMKGALPFGPFLAVAAFVVLFYGHSIADWYVRFLVGGA
jgi:prepilin signal peptidase PulO-like enzyme (type II secretory pathway)